MFAKTRRNRSHKLRIILEGLRGFFFAENLENLRYQASERDIEMEKKLGDRSGKVSAECVIL